MFVCKSIWVQNKYSVSFRNKIFQQNVRKIYTFLQILQQENAELQAGVSLAQAQLETALEAHESQRRVMDTLNTQLAVRIQELAGIHREIATALQT